MPGTRWCLRLTALVAAVMSAAGAQAADPNPVPVQCTFDTGTSWSYDAGKFTSTASSKLTFEISDINLEKQTATLIVDNKQSGALKIVRALNANSFLEVANEGFLNLTTVYDLDAATKTYPAVHSRHFGVLGQPVFAQYAGSCVAK